jgi:hypothetical protein
METYQLLQVPAADLHVASVVVQALGEVPGIGLAASGAPVGALLGLHGRGSGLLSGCRGSATELYPTQSASGLGEKADKNLQDRRFRHRQHGRSSYRQRHPRQWTPSGRRVRVPAAGEPEPAAPEQEVAGVRCAQEPRQWWRGGTAASEQERDERPGERRDGRDHADEPLCLFKGVCGGGRGGGGDDEVLVGGKRSGEEVLAVKVLKT